MKRLIILTLITLPGVSAAQVLEWSYTLGGSGNGWDLPNKVLLDDDGGVYVVGTVFNSDSKEDIVLIKLDTSGNQKWIYTYDGSVYREDKSSDMVLDGHGNIYITGYSNADSTPQCDLIVIKLDTSGTEKWVYLYDVDTIDTSREYGYSLALDSSGNIYTVGRVSYPAFYGGAFLVMSLDSSGALRWSWVYSHDNTDFSACEWHQATKVITDLARGVYVAGCLVDSGWVSVYAQVFVVLKFDTSGSILWKNWGLDCSEGEYCPAFMELGSDGLLYGVTSGRGGYSCLPYYFGLDTATGFGWERRMMLQGDEDIKDMGLSDGGLYSCGEWVNNPYYGSGFVVSRVSLVGELLWETVFVVDTPFATSCANDLAFNAGGDIFAVGDTGDHALAVKLDSSLKNAGWTYDWPDTSAFRSVAMDPFGGIYIAGWRRDSAGNNDILVIKLRDSLATAKEPNPSARIPERMTLSVAPSGFLISGYEGPVQVYDATGRLILIREIKEKSLIGPLNPGVYFVAAGKQRGRVAVLR